MNTPKKCVSLLVFRVCRSVCLFCLASVTSAIVAERPNILLIQADDLGYSDLGIHGNTSIQTPNLDRLGHESLRFDRFYVHPLCAPTRASLLAGKHFWRTGVYGVHAGMDFMNLEETTVAEVLRDAGYRTGMWGKWHSGKTDGYYPWDRGFEEAYMAELYDYEDNLGMLNGKLTPAQGWTPAVLTDYALNFMARDSDQPFFAYVSYLSPHGPWTAPSDYIAPYRSRGFTKHAATLFGMITHMDHHIGRLLDGVDELGLRRSTLVIFLSDNGPARRVKGQPITEKEWEQRVAPLDLRGHKSSPYENGIRSPFFLRWGDQLKPGTNGSLLCVMDILPTLAELGNGRTPEDLDGRSFASLLKNPEAQWPERTLHFSSSHPKLPEGMSRQDTPLDKAAIPAHLQLLTVMSDDYKFLKQGDNRELFNLQYDERERNNLATEQPEKVALLRTSADDWFEGILEDPGSFTRPLLLIGREGKLRTVFPAFCLAESKGGLQNSNHSLDNWKNPGDTAVYNLEIQTPGNYAVGVEFKSAVNRSTRLEIEVGDKKIECIPSGINRGGILKSTHSIHLGKGRNTLAVRLATPLDSPMSMTAISMIRVSD
ncbi:MAG: sulfatase-like hydrolase/transferase [Verrucomicrobiota bacterium]